MAPSSIQRAKVKSALSGDTVILTSVSNPRQERTLSLAFVAAPRIRRDGEEPFGFASRDFLIKNLVGKVVNFQVLYNVPVGVNRDYGRVILQDGRAFPETAVAAGWVKVREDAGKKMDESELSQALIERLELEQAKARADSQGVWGNSADGTPQIQNELQDASAFLEQYKGKTLEAVAERIMTGDRIILRFLLSPKKHLQTMAVIAGIRAPTTKRTNASDGTEQPGEPFANEATQFLEARILQRTLDVQVVGLTPQGQLVCSIAHKEGGDMAGHILREGLARCVDHHSTMLGPGMAKLRQAERSAKEKKLNLFQGHTQATSAGSEAEVTVVRVQTADTIFVRSRSGAERRLNLSSVRQPKPTDPKQAPFQADAKEFLRKKIIGKHVKVTVDGKKPAADGYEERDVATVMLAGKNVALELVEAGYATVIRHRRDDTDRSPIYDELLAAEETATKEKRGMHSGKPTAAKNYVDYSESLQKAKIQASVLQRQKKIPAIVDYVKGASRFTLLIPRENAKLTLVLSCLRTPRTARNPAEQSEPFGQEALDFANRKTLQRDVEVDIEGTDKVGGFIGTLYVNRENYSRALLEEGLASVHAYSAEQSPHGAELFAAEAKAKEGRKGIWKDWDPSQDATEEAEDGPPVNGAAAAETNGHDGSTNGTASLDYREVLVTHIDPETLRLKLQIVGTGTGALEELMSRFRSFHLSHAAGLPAPPRAGDLVSAKFSADQTWYRARVRRNDRDARTAEVVYVDFGNEEKRPWTDLRPLPAEFSTSTLRAQAQDAALSFVQFPHGNRDYLDDAVAYCSQTLLDRPLIANVDFTDTRDNNLLWVTLFAKDLDVRPDDSLNAAILAEGLAMVPRKLRPWERARGAVLDSLRKREAEAKTERRGMWEYGDLTED